MIFDWYKIFSMSEFLGTGLVSRTYSLIFGSLGLRDVLVTKGNEVGLSYADVFLIVGFNSKNPYIRDGYAVYTDNDDVYLGIEVVEA